MPILVDTWTLLLLGAVAGLVFALLFFRQGTTTVIYVPAPSPPEPTNSDGFGCAGLLFLLVLVAVAVVFGLYVW